MRKKLHTIFTYVLYCITNIFKSGLKQELYAENSFSFCLVQGVTYILIFQMKEKAWLTVLKIQSICSKVFRSLKSVANVF